MRIEGRVQGVFFRDYTCRQAIALNLKGWVRNNRDGSVEAVISGREEDVSLLVERIRLGSPNSRVDDVQIHRHQPDELFASFEIRH
jgi:acylphosphatase